MVDYILNNYTMEAYNSKKVLKLPSSIKCGFDPTKEFEPLTNISFQVNGYNFLENKPVKLHHCIVNEMESLYRQLSCGVWYDPLIMDMFIEFSHRFIDIMLLDFKYNIGYTKISLFDYFTKLGSKRDEYIEGYDDYLNYGKLKLIFKMHNKSDEKIYIEPLNPKEKARNICAQLPMGKILLGIVCELGMQVIHSQPWCGPGSSLKEKGEKFSAWSKILGPSMNVLCADGSSFDSTQHEILIKEIDSYFLNKVIDDNGYLSEIYNIRDVRKVANQTLFTIFSKKGFLYQVKGTQLSGRMNTCLSNTLRSALYVSFTIYKSGICKEFIFFEVTGDDQIIMGYYSSLKIYARYAYLYVYSNSNGNIKHGLGQICKIFEFHRNITGAEYLSNYLLYNPDTLNICLIRKPERFFQLIPYTFRNNFKSERKFLLCKAQLAIEVSNAALLNFKNITLYSVYLRRMHKLAVKLLENVVSTYKFSWHDNYTIKKVIDTHKMKTSYQHNENIPAEFNSIFKSFLNDKFGIDDADLEEFYMAISKVSSLDDSINCSLIDKLYKVRTTEQYINLKKFLHKKTSLRSE